jgi:hypothetical protein
VRFGATPAFEVTGDVVQQVGSASQVVQSVLNQAGITDIDQTSFADFHTFNPAPVGIYIDQDTTIIDIVSKIADSVGGGVISNTAGEFAAIWLEEPEAGEVDLTLRDLLSEVSMQIFAGPTNDAQGIPAWKVIVYWGKVWKTQSAGDLAALITDNDQVRKQFLATQWRQAGAADATIKDQHLQAVTMSFETMLVNFADASAEAHRRLALYSTRRDRISFPVSFAQDHSIGDVDLGDSVTVTMPRFGYDNGKNFRVIGRKDDFKTKIRTLNLWG